MKTTVTITVKDALKTYEYEMPFMEWLYLKRKLKAMDKQAQRDKLVGLKRYYNENSPDSKQ